MEEDIKILEEFIKTGYHTLMIKYGKDRIQTNKMVERAIENLIARNKYLEENRIWSEATLEGLKEDFIPKSKIKEKIEELRKEHDKNKEFYGLEFSRTGVVVAEIQVLQELLEDFEETGDHIPRID